MKKTVLITGASSGFGRETARLFHQKGWNVIATMRSPEKETALSNVENVLVLSLYHATKFAVEGLTESLQYELNPLGILLKIIEPGGYRTEFTGRSMGYFGVGGLKDYQAAFDRFAGRLKDWPLGENIGEVADAIYEAATDGTEKLRYPVGDDAAQLIQTRQQMADVDFKKMMVGQTGI